jgi:hypothetical protein
MRKKKGSGSISGIERKLESTRKAIKAENDRIRDAAKKKALETKLAKAQTELSKLKAKGKTSGARKRSRR